MVLKNAKRKLGQNVHQNSGVGALCPPSKIVCDLGQNVLGQNVLGAFCLGAFCLLGQNVSQPLKASENTAKSAEIHDKTSVM